MTHTIRAILAAPILSAGVLAATFSVAAPAIAEPLAGSDCPSMAMPGTQASADAPMDCNAASHG